MAKSIKMKKSTKSSGKPKRSQRPSGSGTIAPSGVRPSSYGFCSTKMEPVFIHGDHSIRVRNGEFVTGLDLPGPGPASWEAQLRKFPLNPGVPGAFPWLSQIANQYEMYRFHRLAFKFVSKCPTSFTGAITLAIDYDALDPAPSDRQTLLSYAGAVTATMWQGLQYAVRPDKLGLFAQQRYTRLGNQSDLDLKTYDLGNLFVHMEDIYTHTGAIPIGDLFVEYDIELFTPQLRSANVASGTLGGEKGENDQFALPTIPTTVLGSLPCSIKNAPSGYTEFTFDRPWEGMISVAQRVVSGTWPGMTAAITALQGGKYTSLDTATSDSQGRTLVDYAIKAFAGDKFSLRMTSPITFSSAVVRLAAGAYGFVGGV